MTSYLSENALLKGTTRLNLWTTGILKDDLLNCTNNASCPVLSFDKTHKKATFHKKQYLALLSMFFFAA